MHVTHVSGKVPPLLTLPACLLCLSCVLAVVHVTFDLLTCDIYTVGADATTGDGGSQRSSGDGNSFPINTPAPGVSQQ